MVDRSDITEDTAEEMLARYRLLRKKLRVINDCLVSFVTPDIARRSGHELGILRGDEIVLDSDEAEIVLVDYAVYANSIQRQKLIDQYRVTYKGKLDEDEIELLRALEEARYMLILCDEIVPPLGLHGEDLLTEQELFLFDVSFSVTLEFNTIIAAHIIAPYGIHMTTGAALPVMNRDAINGLKKILKSYSPSKGGIIDSTQDRGLFAARIIRTLLKHGVTEHVRYA